MEEEKDKNGTTNSEMWLIQSDSQIVLLIAFAISYLNNLT